MSSGLNLRQGHIPLRFTTKATVKSIQIENRIVTWIVNEYGDQTGLLSIVPKYFNSPTCGPVIECLKPQRRKPRSLNSSLYDPLSSPQPGSSFITQS